MTPDAAAGRGKAVLYARVSTEEQARTGYSLAQQLEALRAYAAAEGYDVAEEVEDRGQSGASLERPGLDRVQDLVSAGGICVVLAQDRDRFMREPAYYYLLQKEFEEYGCKLKAMNDRGDDSPEGQLMDGMMDQLAKFERAKTAERTRRGKLRKAREGKVIAGGTPNYGFRYNPARDGYEVDESTMPNVRRIFRMVSVEGASLHAVQRALGREGVRAPKGGRSWSRSLLRSLIQGDAYKPHSVEETAALVSPEVAAGLDAGARYGIWWYNRFRAAPTPARGKRRKFTEKPREEWVAVPVCDSGIPREWVDAAREAIKDNYRPKSKEHRYWEITGGILHCGECGRRMIGHSMTTNRGGKKRRYFYYVCPKKGLEHQRACGNKHHRAEPLEDRVAQAVTGFLGDAARLEQKVEERIRRERGTVADTARIIAELEDRSGRLLVMRHNYQDQQAAGLMTLEELAERLSELDDTRDAIRRDLEAARDNHGRVEEMEREWTRGLKFYAGFASAGVGNLGSEERRRIYNAFGLRVSIHADGRIEISGDFDADFFPPKGTNPRDVIWDSISPNHPYVMSAMSTPTFWASCTPPTRRSRS